jgi:hypothetical protein
MIKFKEFQKMNEATDRFVIITDRNDGSNWGIITGSSLAEVKKSVYELFEESDLEVTYVNPISLKQWISKNK